MDSGTQTDTNGLDHHRNVFEVDSEFNMALLVERVTASTPKVGAL